MQRDGTINDLVAKQHEVTFNTLLRVEKTSLLTLISPAMMPFSKKRLFIRSRIVEAT